MSRRWEDVLAILKGEKSSPLSQFIGFSGALSAEQQGELFSVMEKSEFRRAIRFKGCKINDKGACQFADILSRRRLITSLELPGNQIGKEGALALCRLLQDDRAITGFDLSGNPCEEECPEIMNQIDMYLDRNRELLSCNGSACPSPGVGSPRMQRTKARLVDLSSTTHHPTTSPKQPRLRHLGYGSDIDGVSTKSEQMSTCSDDGDFHTRILLLEERQTKLEQQADQLDQDAEEFHSWKNQFQQSSQNAMESFIKYEAQVHQTRKELEELLTWRGSMEVILEVNSVKIQRQGGDFHGLRDKVMKLHTEFERVHRQLSTGAAPLTPENSLKRSAESPDTPSSSSKGNQEAWTLQELSDKVRGHNETHKELLDEFNKTRAMLEDVMGYYENCEHANATTKTNFESRLAALEKVGIISEEEQASQSALSEALNGLELFRTAIELQVDKIEKRIAVAETLTQQLRQTASSGDQKSLQAAEARLEAKYQQHSQDLESLGFKLEEFEVSTLQARKAQYDNNKELADLQDQVTAALASHRTLESRVNFQEELIMDKSHGEQDLDSAVAAHNTRLDSFEEQLKLLELHTPRIAKFESQIQSLEEKAARLSAIDSDLQELKGASQATQDRVQESLQSRDEDAKTRQRLEQTISGLEDSRATTSSVTQLKEEVSGWHAKLQTEVARSSTQCTEWVDEVRDCLRETETRLQSQVDQLLEKINTADTGSKQEVTILKSEVSNLSGSMHRLFSTLDTHLHAVEDQSAEIAKKLQAEKSWKSSCASKIKALEATSSASQDKEADWDRRVTENSTLAHVLAEEVRLLKENGNSLVGRVDSLLAANKQAGLKDMPDRIQGLEDKVNTLHREQAQLPSWVKRQSQMEQRIETLEEALSSMYRESKDAALQQAINTKFSGHTMYCMAKRFPASYPIDNWADGQSEDTTRSSESNEKENASARSNSDTRSGSKGKVSPSVTVESRALQPRVR